MEVLPTFKSTRGLEFSQSFLENVLNSDKPEENILLISGLPRTAREEDITHFIEYGSEVSLPLGKVYYILLDPSPTETRAIVVLDKWYGWCNSYSLDYKNKIQKGEVIYESFLTGNEDKFSVTEVHIESLWLSECFGFRV